ncbi:hypothetical protein DSC45_02650 [Streptomyces sp. YIM 130001]|uniref:hypothetical protein n=1 Tax=Streptomyces sp. YIM 130001 TaxID=2259644 RepID=UPI000EBE54AD|nr:hypothetical protein [Streptomyces sp. YIM 130001]RII20720.1 hypothetical protein DSC45_02650 [Streptomyces sp. YIM 130001]
MPLSDPHPDIDSAPDSDPNACDGLSESGPIPCYIAAPTSPSYPGPTATQRVSADRAPSAYPAPSDAPDPFSYSLTLPARPTSAGVARGAVRTTLHTHGLTALTFPAMVLVGELIATAVYFTPSPDIYLSLRYRPHDPCPTTEDHALSPSGTLRLIAYDAHPPHTSPHLGALCNARRRTALRVLAAVTKTCTGTWGFGPSHEPGGGTRTWTTLPNTPPATTW